MGLDIIDYTVPTTIPNYDQFNLHHDADEDETGVLAVHDSFLRHGEDEPAGMTDTYFELNSVAANDVFNNQPVVPVGVGTWISAVSSSNGDPSIFHKYGNGYYESSGTCDADASTGAEYGTSSRDLVTGAITATAFVSTRGACSPALNAASGITVAISGNTRTVTVPSVGDIVYNRLVTTANPIVGTWVAGTVNNNLDDHTTLIILDDSTYAMSEGSDSADIECGAGALDGAGMEYGDYTWNSGTGAFNATSIIDSDGTCGISDADVSTIVIEGDVMTMTFTDEDTMVWYRMQ